MKLFEGKSPSERNKIIAALVLGTLSLAALGNMIFAPFSGKKTTVTVKASPTATASATPSRTGDTLVTPLPKQSEIDGTYASTPVFLQYPPSGGEPGRNIFAFYEPPVPTPVIPTPFIQKEVKTPTPIPEPTPNVVLSFINKQSVYAGEKGFTLEVGGDKFTPDTYIFFDGVQLPTRYVSPQQMSAEIPTNYVAGAGQKNIQVRSTDGKLFSNSLFFNIQQPPQPQFQYLGAVARKRGNNDTAYIQEQGKTAPTSVRLNDIISGRFRLVSISPAKLLVQDIQLGFLAPYQIELVKGAGQSATTTIPGRSNPAYPNDPSIYQQPQNNPNAPQTQQCPPGIPCQQYRPYVPPTPAPNKQDVDDDEDGDN